MNKNKLIIKKIATILESIPGIAGFRSIIDHEDDNVLDNCIKIENTNGDNVEIFIGLSIKRNIVIKNIEKEIYDTLKFLLKEEKFTFKKINLFIKGVK